MFTNWKTTLAGVAAILGALADLATYGAQGQISPHFASDYAAFVAGVGLILAKDAVSK